MPISRWIKAVLQHSRATEVVSWIAVSQQGQPPRGRCIGYTKSQECIATGAVLAWLVPAKQWEDMESAFKVPGLQCVLVATAEPEITLLSHILSQIQCGKVQTVIAGLGNEYLPTVKLPGIMTWDAKHAVDGIVRMVTVQIWPKDGVSTSDIPKEG